MGVANHSSIERQKATNHNESMHPKTKLDDHWVSHILEIRASDEHHVYARACWMYWPDELPQGTHDGRKTIQGRQHYHGINELIASNHMDIINVMSVASQARVKQWDGKNDEGKRPLSPSETGAETNGDGARPWEGLFEASLKTADMDAV
ncbi:hypothetical protein F5144DRAFT_252554 [Chaetomium tenue]|uniref:Uncharacterized protein n=1 Tax=Chaetomium tenue TaxID=1854479 RepID=A0ACB7PAJ7_9PEZI|nr:hypothetical protein F5144DRAFT_252554 [Chaetomium globosum]